jgi:hypothetical protein
MKQKRLRHSSTIFFLHAPILPCWIVPAGGCVTASLSRLLLTVVGSAVSFPRVSILINRILQSSPQPPRVNVLLQYPPACLVAAARGRSPQSRMSTPACFGFRGAAQDDRCSAIFYGVDGYVLPLENHVFTYASFSGGFVAQFSTYSYFENSAEEFHPYKTLSTP